MSLWPFVVAGVVVAGATLVVFRARARSAVLARIAPRDVDDLQVRPSGAVGVQERAALWPWALGAAAALGVCVLGAQPVQGAAIGALVAALGHLIAGLLRGRRRVLVEAQLADAIDLMVGALQAGAGFPAAFAAAVREAKAPLRPVLGEVEMRLRLGEDRRTVLAELSRHLGLESFRLFAVTIAVHAEVGGSLAPTLSGVARAVRDRVDVARQINVQTAEARFSGVVVLVLAYAVAALSWRRDPSAMQGFLSSPTGGAIVAGAIALQALGLVWIARILRARGA